MRPTYLLSAMVLTAAMSRTAAAQTAIAPTVADGARYNWVVSGFAGANFDTTGGHTENIDVSDLDGNTSLEFGGQLGFLWRGFVGAEAVVDFAPSMGVAGVVFADKPNVYSYMANAIGGYPLGVDGKYHPYVSGGFGAIQLRGEVLNTIGNPSDGATSSNEVKFGGNIGGGLMAFAGRFGVRGDIRYYHSAADGNTLKRTRADFITQAALTGLSFWRGNVGMAIRW